MLPRTTGLLARLTTVRLIVVLSVSVEVSRGQLTSAGCRHQGRVFEVGEVVRGGQPSNSCMETKCGAGGTVRRKINADCFLLMTKSKNAARKQEVIRPKKSSLSESPTKAPRRAPVENGAGVSTVPRVALRSVQKKIIKTRVNQRKLTLARSQVTEPPARREITKIESEKQETKERTSQRTSSDLQSSSVLQLLTTLGREQQTAAQQTPERQPVRTDGSRVHQPHQRRRTSPKSIDFDDDLITDLLPRRRPLPLTRRIRTQTREESSPQSTIRGCVFEGQTFRPGETVSISNNFCTTIRCHPDGSRIVRTTHPRCLPSGIISTESELTLSSATEPPLRPRPVREDFTSQQNVDYFTEDDDVTSNSADEREDDVFCVYEGRVYSPFDVVFTDGRCMTARCLSTGDVVLSQFCDDIDAVFHSTRRLQQSSTPPPDLNTVDDNLPEFSVLRRSPFKGASRDSVRLSAPRGCLYSGRPYSVGDIILDISECYKAVCGLNGLPQIRNTLDTCRTTS